MAEVLPVIQADYDRADTIISRFASHEIGIVADDVAIVREMLANEFARHRIAGQAELREALEFYRDGFAPKPGKHGLEWRPTEAILEDCGERARAALQPLSQAGEGSK